MRVGGSRAEASRDSTRMGCISNQSIYSGKTPVRAAATGGGSPSNRSPPPSGSAAFKGAPPLEHDGLRWNHLSAESCSRIKSVELDSGFGSLRSEPIKL